MKPLLTVLALLILATAPAYGAQDSSEPEDAPNEAEEYEAEEESEGNDFFCDYSKAC